MDVASVPVRWPRPPSDAISDWYSGTLQAEVASKQVSCVEWDRVGKGMSLCVGWLDAGLNAGDRPSSDWQESEIGNAAPVRCGGTDQLQLLNEDPRATS